MFHRASSKPAIPFTATVRSKKSSYAEVQQKNKVVIGVSSRHVRKILIPFTTAHVSTHFAFIVDGGWAGKQTPYIHIREINLKKNHKQGMFF